MTKEYIFINYYDHFDCITEKKHHFKYGDKIFLTEKFFPNGDKYYFF